MILTKKWQVIATKEPHANLGKGWTYHVPKHDMASIRAMADRNAVYLANRRHKDGSTTLEVKSGG